MTTADLALLITSTVGALAALITALAAYRNSTYNAARVKDLEDRNKKLEDENQRKTEHNTYQDALIFDQHLKIEQYQRWGDRVGRMLNQMQLQLGTGQRPPAANDDTQPLKLPVNRDWITGPLGPLPITEVTHDDPEPGDHLP